MWVSRKKWSELEKRVADLERQVQSQHKDDVSPLNTMKAALAESLCQLPQSTSIQITIPKESLPIVVPKC